MSDQDQQPSNGSGNKAKDGGGRGRFSTLFSISRKTVGVHPGQPKLSPRHTAQAQYSSPNEKEQPAEQPEPASSGAKSLTRRTSPEVGSLVNELSLRDGPRSQQTSVSHKRTAEQSPQSKRHKHSTQAPASAAIAPRQHVHDAGHNPVSTTAQHPSLSILAQGGPGASSYNDSPTSPEDGYDVDQPEGDITMLLQPETKRITQDQLINEVKGIYAGLVMVERKCVEITQARATAASKLTHDQWQALIALHRTLLNEHHDFFLASQHPTASPALRRLATKYAMPARMWRHAIHSFLELLRQQLPHSLEHMLSFVYIAYAMMALLMESVPSFLETWIECLGDLARYRMAIEEADMRDREIWSNVARTWYNKAADRSPNVGRIQHHLAVLARPNIVQQLFFYTKALVSVVPFTNARDSIMLLFNPLLDKDDASHFDRYPVVEASFVTAFGLLFTRGHPLEYHTLIQACLTGLDEQIIRMGAKWKTQGPEVAATLIAGAFDFGHEQNPIWTMYQDFLVTVKSRRSSPEPTNPAILDAEDAETRTILQHEFWANLNTSDAALRKAIPRNAGAVDISSTEAITINVLGAFRSAVAINSRKIGDRNIVPFMHFVLSFTWSLSYVGRAMIYLESQIPWQCLVTFLNTVTRSGVSYDRVEAEAFPQSINGTGHQLPEDWLARGLVWTQHVYPHDFFRINVTDEDERTLELPSHTAPRAERCLWLGVRLASLKRYIDYDTTTKEFSVSEYALSLEQGALGKSQQSIPSPNDTLAEKPLRPEVAHHEIPMSDMQSGDARTVETDADYVVIDRADPALADRDNDKSMTGG